MLLMRYYILTPFLILSLTVNAKTKIEKNDSLGTMSYAVNSQNKYIYSRPKPFEFITVLPRDYSDFTKKVFRKEQFLNLALITSSTAILIAYDQQILDAAKHFGSAIHLKGTSNQTSLFKESVKIANKEIPIEFNVPTDLNSSFYFIGDGWVHTTFAFAYWINGLITNDYRSLRTASEIGECIFTSGLATQIIKHITGRESPYTTNVPGGVWRFFPNQKRYADGTPHYDAFPTGHLATAMATVTVIADNYSEVKYIRPIGYTLMTLLGFSMLNNGVHWAGDYPLGIAMGYVFAKVAVHHGRKIESESNTTFLENHWKFSPSFSVVPNEYGMGVGVKWNLVKSR